MTGAGFDFDPQLEDFLRRNDMLDPPKSYETASIQEQRKAFLAPFLKLKSKVPVKSIRDQTVPGPNGNKVPIRIYHPAGAVDRKKGLPILVFFHGGSFYMGNLDSHDDMCRNLGHLAAYIVVAVDYRLAPEHKFPAQHLDCYAATVWAYENAASLGGDQSYVAVGGDSAGANIAAAVCIMARDMKGPKLSMQVLIYPVTDYYEPGSKSMNELGNIAPVLTKAGVAKAFDTLLASPEDRHSELLDLNHAPSVKNLPPAFVVTAEYDVLRDEAEYYAARLHKNGVTARAKRYGGAVHGFIHFGSLAEIRCAVRAIEEIAIAMRQVVKPESEPWTLRHFVVISVACIAFLAVKGWNYYNTGRLI